MRTTDTPVMRLAIMQPYLFPYLGYYQLVSAVDRFVVYDDVSFIKQGWINRNKILVAGAAHRFTLPLEDAGSNRRINEIALHTGSYPAWRDKFLRTLRQSYARAPFLQQGLELVEEVLPQGATQLSQVLVASLLAVKERLGITTTIVPSSAVYADQGLRGAERILDICRQEGAARYVNAIGGSELYDRGQFEARGVQLSFLRSRLPEYRQFNAPFVPGLSIIDAFMFVPADGITAMLPQFDLE